MLDFRSLSLAAASGLDFSMTAGTWNVPAIILWSAAGGVCAVLAVMRWQASDDTAAWRGSKAASRVRQIARGEYPT